MENKHQSIKDSFGILFFLIVLLFAIVSIVPIYKRVNNSVKNYVEKLCLELEDKTGLTVSYRSLSPSILTGFRVKGILLKDTFDDDVVVEDYAEFSLTENEADLINKYSVTIDSFSSDRVYEKIREFNSKNILNDKKKNFKPIEISNEGLEMIEFISLDCETSEGAWTSSSEIKIDKNGYVILNGKKTKEFWDGKINSETKPLRLKIRNICGDETVWKIKG